MIEQVPDQATRRLLAFQGRQMVTCRLSAQEFDYLLLDTNHPFYTSDAGNDAAIFYVSHKGFWTLYDDYRTIYLNGEWALSREKRREVARWMLFLYTDLPYEWWEPSLSLTMQIRRWLNRITEGRVRYEAPYVEEPGNKDFWPFYRQADYEAALKRPPLLCGRQAV